MHARAIAGVVHLPSFLADGHANRPLSDSFLFTTCLIPEFTVSNASQASSIQIEVKEDKSLLTSADRAANEVSHVLNRQRLAGAAVSASSTCRCCRMLLLPLD